MRTRKYMVPQSFSFMLDKNNMVIDAAPRKVDITRRVVDRVNFLLVTKQYSEAKDLMQEFPDIQQHFNHKAFEALA